MLLRIREARADRICLRNYDVGGIWFSTVFNNTDEKVGWKILGSLLNVEKVKPLRLSQKSSWIFTLFQVLFHKTRVNQLLSKKNSDFPEIFSCHKNFVTSELYILQQLTNLSLSLLSTNVSLLLSVMSNAALNLLGYFVFLF